MNPWQNGNGSDSDLMQLYKTGQSGGRNPVQETQYQGLLKSAGLPSDATPTSSGSSGGSSGYNVQALLDAQNKQISDNQKAISDFTTNFQNATPGIVSNEENKYNVAPLAQTATSLGNKIAALGQNVGNSATGYSSGDQINEAIGSQFAPNYQLATNTAQTAENLANIGITRDLAPWQAQASLLGGSLPGYVTAAAGNVQNALQNEYKTLPINTQLYNTETGRTTTNTGNTTQTPQTPQASNTGSNTGNVVTPTNQAILDGIVNSQNASKNVSSTGSGFSQFDPSVLNDVIFNNSNNSNNNPYVYG